MEKSVAGDINEGVVNIQIVFKATELERIVKKIKANRIYMLKGLVLGIGLP